MPHTTRGLSFVALLFAILPAVTAAGVVGPNRPSDIVTVNATGNTRGCGGDILKMFFDRVMPSDGSTPTLAPFTAPPGKVLIVTDVSVVVGGMVDVGVGAYLFTGDATSASPVTADFTTSTSPDGLARVHFTFPNGLVIKSGQSLCVVPYNAVIDVNSSFNGYLTKDR